MHFKEGDKYKIKTYLLLAHFQKFEFLAYFPLKCPFITFPEVDIGEVQCTLMLTI